MSAASIIDYSRRLEINHEPWTVRRLTTFYEKPVRNADGSFTEGAGRLYLPPHQREWSWTDRKGLEKMRKFIDSVLHNYPIHTIILNAIDDGTRERWAIYDGRHRVETLWRFAHNEFSLIVDDGEPVWYNKDGARSLSDSDRARFNDRQIPVATTSAASPSQLADVFIRLNSGKPLTQADYCWACRDSPLIRSTMAILEANKERFRPLFGGADITNRKTLPDWVGIFAGIVTNHAGHMTTSFERLSAHLDTEVPPAAGAAAMDALFDLYTRANAAAVVSASTLKKYQALGFINAFFFDAWLCAADKETAIANWVRVIVHIRTTFNKYVVTVTGAQNLNDRKLTEVREKVRDWLETGHVAAGAGTDSEEEDDD